MLSLYFTNVMLSVLEDKSLYEMKVPMDEDIRYGIYEITSVESYIKETDSMYNSENKEVGIKITIREEISKIYTRKTYVIEVSKEEINRIIDECYVIFEYYFNNQDNFLSFKKANETFIMNVKKENYPKESLEEFRKSYAEIYQHFINDLKLLLFNNIEEISMKKTLTDSLILMFISTNINSTSSSTKSNLKYILNVRKMIRDVTPMSEIAMFNLYFFAYMHKEKKDI